MKQTLLLTFLVLSFASAIAQAPQKFNYQGIARNGTGAPLASTALGLRITIHDGSAGGPVVYQETHLAATNAYGLYNLAVGAGAVVSGVFSTISWSSGDKYIQVEMDPAGGSTYTDLGASQLLSVPFALNGGVTSITVAPPLSGGTISGSGTIGLPVSGVASGTYGSATNVPVITTDAYGRITAATVAPISGSVLSGDVSGPAASNTVGKIQGRPVSSSAPAIGQVLQWDGTQWLPTPNLTGTGTTNFITKFTAAGTAIGNSVMYESAGNIGVGTTAPTSPLHAVSATVATNGVVRGEYTGATTTSNSVGVYGKSMPSLSSDAGWGSVGDGGAVGVMGRGISTTTLASSQSIGVNGESTTDADYSVGVAGFSDRYSPSSTGCLNSYGIYGNGTGAASIANDWAGWFAGRVTVTGMLIKGGGTFKIDHPLDPENKYLSHSFVESPDMMNIYNGNITTDAAGIASVALPSYFDALNKEFRYQLTVIGTFAQAIISKEISGNAFEIKTSVPNVKVSWQVTGVRKDVWANANRVIPETEKSQSEKGKYFHAAEYGKDESLQIGNIKKPSTRQAVNKDAQKRK
jgi:hypothetical protein